MNNTSSQIITFISSTINCFDKQVLKYLVVENKTQLTWRWTWFRICDRWARWGIINKWLIETIEETLTVTITLNSNQKVILNGSLRDKNVDWDLKKVTFSVRFLAYIRYVTYLVHPEIVQNAGKQVTEMFWKCFEKDFEIGFYGSDHERPCPRQSKMWN